MSELPPPPWFTEVSADPPTDADQVWFLSAVDGLLVRLDPPGASKGESWFTAFEAQTIFSAASLIICIALSHTKHDSIQMAFDGSTFYGTWEDRHYAFDSGVPPVIARVSDQGKAPALATTLAWLEDEMRQPVLLVRGPGPFRWTRTLAFPSQFDRPEVRKRLDDAIPAGFFDPLTWRSARGRGREPRRRAVGLSRGPRDVR